MDSSSLVFLIPMQFNYQKLQIDLYNIYYRWPPRYHVIYSFVWQVWPLPGIFMIIPKLSSVPIKPIFVNYFLKRRKMLESFCIIWKETGCSIGNRLTFCFVSFSTVPGVVSAPGPVSALSNSLSTSEAVFFCHLWLWLMSASSTLEE